MRNLIVLVRTNTIDNEYCYHYKSLNIEFDEVPMNIDDADGKEGNDDEKGVEEVLCRIVRSTWTKQLPPNQNHPAPLLVHQPPPPPPPLRHPQSNTS